MKKSMETGMDLPLLLTWIFFANGTCSFAATGTRTPRENMCLNTMWIVAVQVSKHLSCDIVI